MTDISKCKNEECPLKENCWRFKAPRNLMYQSYADFEPDKEGKCDAYWPIDKK